MDKKLNKSIIINFKDVIVNYNKSNEDNKEYFQYIQWLRGIAVISILLSCYFYDKFIHAFYGFDM